MLLLFMLLVVIFTGTTLYAEEPTIEHSAIDGHIANAAQESKHEGGGHGGAEETPPEHYAVMDFFAEAIESSTIGLWIKITELRPKVEHIQALYKSGKQDEAMAKGLGVATEVILLGFFIETFELGHLFVAALSFSENWWLQLGMSLGGVSLSTKAAVAIAEKIEEAVEEKLEHDKHAKPTTPH